MELKSLPKVISGKYFTKFRKVGLEADINKYGFDKVETKMLELIISTHRFKMDFIKMAVKELEYSLKAEKKVNPFSDLAIFTDALLTNSAVWPAY